MYLFEKQNFTFTTFCNNNENDTMVLQLESTPFLFVVWDDLRSILGMNCGLGIICSTVQGLSRPFL